MYIVSACCKQIRMDVNFSILTYKKKTVSPENIEPNLLGKSWNAEKRKSSKWEKEKEKILLCWMQFIRVVHSQANIGEHRMKNDTTKSSSGPCTVTVMPACNLMYYYLTEFILDSKSLASVLLFYILFRWYFAVGIDITNSMSHIYHTRVSRKP